MRKLGLIGGVGPESTVPYYQGIVFGVQKRLAKPCFPELVIESLSAFEVIGMGGRRDYAGLRDYLLTGIRHLAAAGAQFGALACNTGHLVFDALQRESPIPLVSIVDVTRDEAQRLGLRRVGLLGTDATMREDFFKRPFQNAGIAVVTPHEEEMQFVSHVILHELELGIVSKETAERMAALVQTMKKRDGIEAVVLGCTELPLLFAREVPALPLLDTMQLHIAALIEEVLR